MKDLIFWLRRRRAGYPVPFGSKSSNVVTYSAMARLAEGSGRHFSDCATHNEPAFPNGPCDCGAKQ